MGRQQTTGSVSTGSGISRRALAIFGLVALSTLLFVQLQSGLPNFGNKYSSGAASILGNADYASIDRPEMIMNPGEQYVTYLPFAGMTNQFMALEKAVKVAIRLNRTLVIPPVVTSNHDDFTGHKAWSTFFNLGIMANKTGLRYIEWKEFKPLTEVQLEIGIRESNRGAFTTEKVSQEWEALAQQVEVQIMYGYGAWRDFTGTEKSFAEQYMLKLDLQGPWPRKPETIVEDRTKVGSKDNMNMTDVVMIDDLADRYRDYPGQLLFLSHAFHLKDWGGASKFWTEVGRYMPFSDTMLAYAKHLVARHSRLDGVLLDTAEEADFDGDYIAIHLRRGDIWIKCRATDSDGKQVISSRCEAPIANYEREVVKAQQIAMSGENGRKTPMPVIVLTDSTDPKDFEQIAAFGWQRLDHDKFETFHTLGFFGPTMVDSCIMANAKVFIGTPASTMTRIAASRQKAWYGREAIYPELPPVGETMEKPTRNKRRL